MRPTVLSSSVLTPLTESWIAVRMPPSASVTNSCASSMPLTRTVIEPCTARSRRHRKSERYMSIMKLHARGCEEEGQCRRMRV